MFLIIYNIHQVKILLHIASAHTEDENNFLQRTAIFLLNSLASQVDNSHKQLLGSLGAVECMLNIVKLKTEKKVGNLKKWFLNVM